MTGSQREVWRRHLEADHIPYRADCSVCVEAQATGRPHRRKARHSGFALAVDLAGPFRHPGRDIHHKDYKYLMVAAYRVPKACLQAINTEEIEEALRVVDEDLVPDDLMEEDDRSVCPERDEEDRGLLLRWTNVRSWKRK